MYAVEANSVHLLSMTGSDNATHEGEKHVPTNPGIILGTIDLNTSHGVPFEVGETSTIEGAVN